MPLASSTIKRHRAARADKNACARKNKSDFNFTPTIGRLNTSDFKAPEPEPRAVLEHDGGMSILPPMRTPGLQDVLSKCNLKAPDTTPDSVVVEGTSDSGVVPVVEIAVRRKRNKCDKPNRECDDVEPWFHKYGIQSMENANYFNHFNRAIIKAAAENNTELINILREEYENGDKISHKKAMEQTLLFAMHNKDLAMVETLLKAGAGYLSTSPMLLHAIDFNQYDIVDLLLKYGCDANAYRGDGTALILVARKGSLSALETLIAAGANIHAVDAIQKVTPLGAAAQANQVDVVEMLLRHGANANAADVIWGRTPLHWSIINNNTKMTDLLLKHGADPLKHDSKQNTTLMFAVKNNNFDMIKMLAPMHDINFKDSRGKTAIHKACENYNSDITDTVLYLLSIGADVNCEDNEGNIPLWRAVMACKPEMVELLAPHSNINHANKLGLTIFHLALNKISQSVGRKMLDILVKFGANINARYVQGKRTAMMKHFGDINKLTWLLQAGADPNLYTDYGWTALWFAAKAGKQDCVKLLLKNNSCMDNPMLNQKSDIQTCDIELSTSPLQEAIWGGHIDIIRLLVIAGCPLEGIQCWLESNYPEMHDNEDFKICMKWLRRRLFIPRPLQEICRIAIRAHCGPVDFRERISKLPLPSATKKFLNVPELDLIEEATVESVASMMSLMSF